jgi:hypothetical protein
MIDNSFEYSPQCKNVKHNQNTREWSHRQETWRNQSPHYAIILWFCKRLVKTMWSRTEFNPVFAEFSLHKKVTFQSVALCIIQAKHAMDCTPSRLKYCRIESDSLTMDFTDIKRRPSHVWYRATLFDMAYSAHLQPSLCSTNMKSSNWTVWKKRVTA